MLQDELEPLKGMIHELIMSDSGGHACLTAVDPAKTLEVVRMLCGRMKTTWLQAVFSELPDHSLKRYFDFHLGGIRELSDALFAHMRLTGLPHRDDLRLILVNEELSALIRHLRQYLPAFFDSHASAPLFWRERIFRDNLAFVITFSPQLEVADSPVALKYCVSHYLQEMSGAEQGGFCSFYALDYYKVFVQQLAEALTTGAVTDLRLREVLYALNFNRLEFLIYYQVTIRERLLQAPDLSGQLEILQREKRGIHQGLLPGSMACHPDFEAIHIMRGKWLEEQIAMIGREAMFLVKETCKFSREKIRLNLSVAHIACLIRLLVDDHYLSIHVLQELFQFVAEHFSSKRQELISAGSLSKEYYSISQSTAARVQGILQKLVDKVTKDFFR
jgi:hypothetical protein